MLSLEKISSTYKKENDEKGIQVRNKKIYIKIK